MDELYFEEGYVEARYFGIIANASSGSRYFLEGYLPSDYFEYRGSFASLSCDFEIVIIGTTKEFEIAVQSQFDSTTAGVKTVSGNAVFNSEFTQTAIGVRGQDTDLFAFTDAAIQAQVDRIRDINQEATAYFSVSADVARIRALDTDAFGGFSFVGNVQRSRATEMETQAAFSFDVSEDLFKAFDAVLSDEFTQTTNEDLFKAFDSALSSEFTQSSTEDIFRDVDAVLSIEATVSAEFRVVRDAHLTGTGVAAIECLAVKTVDESSSQSSETALTSLSGKLQSAQSQQPFRFVVLAVSDRRDNKLYFNQNNNVTFTSQGAVLAQSGEIISTAKSSSEEWVSLPYFGQVYTTAPQSASTSNYNISLTVTLASSTHDPGIIVKAGQNTSSGQHWWNIRIQHFNATTKRIYLSSNEYDSGSRVWDVDNVDWTQPTTIRFSGVYATNYVSGLRRVSLRVNNTTIGSSIRHDGNSGDWTTQADPRISFVNTSSLPVIIEDFTFSKPSLPASAYSDGLIRGINLAFDTRQLLNFDGLDDEYYIDHIGSAAISAETALSAAIRVDYNPTVSIQSQFDVSADVNKVGEVNLVAFSDAAVTTDAGKITENVIASEIISSQSADAQRFRDIDVQIEAEYTQTSDVNVQRSAELQIQSDFAQSTDGVKTTDTGSIIESTTALTASGGRLEEINLVAFSDGRIEVSVRKFTSYSSNINAEITTVVDAGMIFPLSSDSQAEASVSVQQDRLRDNDINSQLSFSLANTGERTRFGIIDIDARHKTTQTYFNEEFGLYIEDGYFEQSEITANIIAGGSSSISSEFTISALIGGSFFAELVSTSAATVDATAVKQVSAEIDKASEFALAATVSPIRDFNSNINSLFTVFANGVTGGEINAVLFDAATLSVTAEANKTFDADLNSEFTQFTDTFGSLNGSLESDQSAEFSQSTDISVIRNAVIATESIATSLTVAVKETVTDVLCETRFDIVIDGAKVTDVTSSNDAAVAISIAPVRTADSVADITAVSTLTADAVVVISAVIQTESVASTLSAVVKVAAFFVNAEVQSSVSADVNVQRSADSQLDAVTEQITDGAAVRSAVSVNAITSSVDALVGVVKPFEATISSAMAFTAGVREIRTDVVVYVIPAEGWEYKITGEGREYQIIGETGVREIAAESRYRTIKGESRIYIVE